MLHKPILVEQSTASFADFLFPVDLTGKYVSRREDHEDLVLGDSNIQDGPNLIGSQEDPKVQQERN